MTNRPIGIFDSGVGGLTVLMEVKKTLPNESVVYVGDTANVPYGSKTHDQLLGYGRNIIKFLRSKNVKAVVLACGTTSSTVYEELVSECPDIPLVDVIRPGVKACVELADQHPGLRLGLIATTATIKSGLFEKLLKHERPDIKLLTQACPLFAPMVEAGVTHSPVAEWAAEAYLGNWRDSIDALVLGCTHYPLLTDALKKALGTDIRFVNLASHTAYALKAQLAATGSLNDNCTPPSYEYYVSGNPDAFNKTAGYLTDSCPGAVKIELS